MELHTAKTASRLPPSTFRSVIIHLYRLVDSYSFQTQSFVRFEFCSCHDHGLFSVVVTAQNL